MEARSTLKDYYTFEYYETLDDLKLFDPREGISVYQNLQREACMTTQNFLQHFIKIRIEHIKIIQYKKLVY